MSLLLNAIRTMAAARRHRPEPDVPSPENDANAQPPDARAPEPGNAAPPPAWRLLDAQTGVQAIDYGEHARPGVQALFGHQPRRLLDIGCATGAVGAGLKGAIPGLWVWGCELNEQAAAVAARRLDHVSTAPRERWSADDLARIGSIDTVLLLDVLEHMYNPWAELEFLARHLPPGAQVVVSLPNVGHFAVLEQLARGAFPYSPQGILDVTHVRFFTYAGMLEMFDQTGFEVESASALSRSPATPIAQFPARVVAGKLALEVDTADDWERLQTIQYGFRLRPRPTPAPR
jgi:2-polyprenyl-3-methyl-5-hydroxy-6-metoxy-1,4-benzoquinol methylase